LAAREACNAARDSLVCCTVAGLGEVGMTTVAAEATGDKLELASIEVERPCMQQKFVILRRNWAL
jgi:hypothetical protein